MTQQFVVTTLIAGQTRSQLWNPELPLALGHPLRWIAERTRAGIRIRDLAIRPGQIAEKSFCEIPQDKILSGAEIALPHSRGVSIRIRPVQTTRAAFGSAKGDQLSVFACTGEWILGSTPFSSRYEGLVGETSVFAMSEAAGSFSFEAKADGVKLQIADAAAKELKRGESIQIGSAELRDAILHYGERSWRFGRSQAVTLSESVGAVTDQEGEWFKRALRYVTVGFGAFMVMTWLWPKPQVDTKEIVPAQFAKIVMSKPKAQSKASSAASEAAPAASQAPKSVQNAAVVQAFRAKALSNAVSGLLKGGMTSLLAQSDFVAGRSAEARRSFDSKSGALGATAGATGIASDTNVKVGTIGGAAGGKGAGYAKGEHAGVKGQGQAFVSMDIAGVSVDEGLTKDEVGEVIHRHLSEVRYCYESAMIRTPDLEGKLMVNFTIGGNGVVKSTEVKSSTLPDPRLDDCILRRLASWKFPNPRGGIDVAVTYPFIFKTLGR